MLVLVSRYCREPQDYVYFTTKNKGSNCSYSIKQAKRFKSVEAIDKHFDSLIVPEELQEIKIWRDYWTTREVNNVTTLDPITEFKPVGNFVLRNKDGYFYGGTDSWGFGLFSVPLIEARQFNDVSQICFEWLEMYEIKHCFVGVNGLVLSKPNTEWQKTPINYSDLTWEDLRIKLNSSDLEIEPKSTDVVLGNQVQPKNTDVVLSPNN